MTELDGVVFLLLLLCVGVIWLAMEVKKTYDAVEPLANSRIVQALSAA